MTLRRFWIRFVAHPSLKIPRPGCGVTAYNVEDALSILRATVFEGGTLPAVATIIEDVDISTLDQKHVIPNMEAPVWRGVWYPRGFASATNVRAF